MSNYDEALERFHLADLETAAGLASHGPMAAEALESLGHEALIPGLVDVYAPRLPPASGGRVLPEEERPLALGDDERRGDWVATYEARLAADDWPVLLADAVPGLLPGLLAAAGHGLLRTAHAVRALQREDTPLRRRELARGLAHWSARFQGLPVEPDPPTPPADPKGSVLGFLTSLPLAGEPEWREALFVDAVRQLPSLPAFVQALEAMPGPPVSPEGVHQQLGAIARAGATLYLAHPEARIAYVHAVTWPLAMATLAPWLDDRVLRGGAHRVLLAVAALHAVYGESVERREPDEAVQKAAESWPEMRYRAACSLQEHAIKMVDACGREDERAPDPILRLAAADAAIALEGERRSGRF